MAQHVLPELARQGARSVTIWSAACSSGQEAYSLAMLLLDWLALNPGVRTQILGTDISPTMVERARAARYTQLEINRGLPAQYLIRHFDQVGREWVLKPQVRSMARFERSNLAVPPVGVPPCDIVFLRNVLIYFDVDTKRTVLGHVRRVLRPGGYLLLGGAESTLNLDDAFQRMELGRAVVFRLAGGAAVTVLHELDQAREDLEALLADVLRATFGEEPCVLPAGVQDAAHSWPEPAAGARTPTTRRRSPLPCWPSGTTRKAPGSASGCAYRPGWRTGWPPGCSHPTSRRPTTSSTPSASSRTSPAATSSRCSSRRHGCRCRPPSSGRPAWPPQIRRVRGDDACARSSSARWPS